MFSLFHISELSHSSIVCCDLRAVVSTLSSYVCRGVSLAWCLAANFLVTRIHLIHLKARVHPLLVRTVLGRISELVQSWDHSTSLVDRSVGISLNYLCAYVCFLFLSFFLKLNHGSAVTCRLWKCRFLIFFHHKCLKCVLLTFFLEYPVELAVIFVSILLHHRFKQTFQIEVIRLLFKLAVATILNVLHEFFWNASRKLFNSSLALLFSNFVVFVIFVFARQSLPRQLSF